MTDMMFLTLVIAIPAIITIVMVILAVVKGAGDGFGTYLLGGLVYFVTSLIITAIVGSFAACFLAKYEVTTTEETAEVVFVNTNSSNTRSGESRIYYNVGVLNEEKDLYVTISVPRDEFKGVKAGDTVTVLINKTECSMKLLSHDTIEYTLAD